MLKNRLTDPLIVFMVSCPEKSFDSPKSIILTHVGSFLFASMKFSGLMSLWLIFCECRYTSALRSWYMIIAASLSFRCLRSRMKWKSSPPWQYLD